MPAARCSWASRRTAAGIKINGSGYDVGLRRYF
jgi:hypothetical protein